MINLAVTFLYTFDRMEAEHGDVLLVLEAVTVAFFALDYGLRVWTAPIQWSKVSVGRATMKYLFSFSGIVDLDISRKTVIIMIKRNGRAIIPKGGVRLHEDDHVIVYSQAHIAGAELITI